jgi:ParB/RepB/Spo0J family partition protein
MADEHPARELGYIPLDRLVESPNNPRQRFGDLPGLAASIRSAGRVLEPLLVRPLSATKFEIVAGARRFRAAKLAGYDEVPAIVEAMDDTEALELQLVENEQREDVHPLEQSQGFATLMALDPKTYTAASIASKMGISESQVWQRLKLGSLIPEAKKLFLDDKFTTGHAILIARLTPSDQKRAMAELFEKYGNDKGNACSVRDLNHWLTDHIKLDLLADTLDQEHPELAKALAKMKEKGVAPLVLSHSYTDDKGKNAALSQNRWKAVGKKKCKHTRPGVIVLGEDQADVLDVCTETNCRMHWPRSAYTSSSPKLSEAEKTKAAKAASTRRGEQEHQKKQKTLRYTAMLSLVDQLAGKARRFTPVALRQIAAALWETIDYEDLADGPQKTFHMKNPGQVKAGVLLPFIVCCVAVASETAGDSKKAVDALAKSYGIDFPKLLAQIGKASATHPGTATAAASTKAKGKKKTA